MKTLRLILGLLCCAYAFPQNISQFGGIYSAINYAYGSGSLGALAITGGNSSTGASTITLAYGTVTLSDGVTVISPLATNAPIFVGNGANIETVTPIALGCSTPQIPNSCRFTANFTKIHGAGERVSSGTFGLYEALNAAAVRGGSAIIDGDWVAAGGTQGMVDAAPTFGNALIIDNRDGFSGGGTGTGTVTSVTATTPLTGGTIHTAGSIGCQVASASQAGCLSATDYSTFTGKQPAGNYPIGAGSTTSGFLPTWTSSTGGSLGAGLGITGTATKVVTAPAAGTSGNCAQWLTGNLVDSGSACGSGGGSVTWPATGYLVLSNSTSSPAGIAPVNGDCVIGSGGAWTAGSCSGSGGTTATALQNGLLSAIPTCATNGQIYQANDQPDGQQEYNCSNVGGTFHWVQKLNIGSGGLSITGGTLDVDHSIIGCLACANLWTANQAEALGAKWTSTHGTVTQTSGWAAIASGTSGAIATSSIAALGTPGVAGDWVQLSNQNCTGILGYSIVAATSVTITDSVTESCSVHWVINHDQ